MTPLMPPVAAYVRHPLPLVLLLCGLFTSHAAAQSADRIRSTSGSESGEITRMTPTTVTIERGGKSKDVAVPEIRSIIFRGEPSELTQARLNANNGGYESALSTLKNLNMANVRGEFIEQEVAFIKAYSQAKLALMGAMPIPEAGTEMNNFVKNYPTNFHFLEATELLGDLLVSMGNYPAAQAKYELLAKAPWPAYQMRSGVLVGQSLLAQEKFDQARAQFESVLAIEDDSDEGKQQRLAAKLGQAVAIAASGNVDAGIQAVEQVIRDADPENADLLARAYNALGACHAQAGQSKEALFAYLHVDLLYGRVADAHAEALYHLAPLWESIGQEGEARRARQALTERYSASRWAQQLGQ